MFGASRNDGILPIPPAPFPGSFLMIVENFLRFMYYLCLSKRINRKTSIRSTMKTPKKIISILLLILPVWIKAETKEISFTLDDRDRIIRTEQKVEALEDKIDQKVDNLRSEMNGKFDGLRSEMNARFDQLFNFLWAIIGIFTAMMISVFGFAFWDRKLSLAPLKKEDQKIVSVLVDFAKTQPKLSEILKNAGLL